MWRRCLLSGMAAWLVTIAPASAFLAYVSNEKSNTVSGIDQLQSTTREGVSTLVVQFLLEKDGDVAAQEVRDKVSSALKQLPEGMEPPLVNKFDMDAAPIMTIGVSGRRDAREVTEIAKHQIQEPLQTVSGVGSVFPAASVALTWKVWLPSARPE